MAQARLFIKNEFQSDSITDIQQQLKQHKIALEPRHMTAALDKEQSHAEIIEHYSLTKQQLLSLIDSVHPTFELSEDMVLQNVNQSKNMNYPALFIIEDSIDYSAYDTFHQNQDLAGNGVHEFTILLCGQGYVYRRQLNPTQELRLELDCSITQGWNLYFDGGLPHIGSVSQATAGSTILVQTLTTKNWSTRNCD